MTYTTSITTKAANAELSNPSTPSKKKTFLLKELEGRAKKLHFNLGDLQRRTVSIARDLGEVLVKLKGELKCGNWETYVKEELGIHYRQASNYMRIWRETKGFKTLEDYYRSEMISDLGIAEILKHFAKKKQSLQNEIEGSKQEKEDNRPIKLADGSSLDTRKLKLKSGVINEADLDEIFTSDSDMDAPRRASLQRVTAHLASVTNCTLGSREDIDAIIMAEQAAKEFLAAIQKKRLQIETA